MTISFLDLARNWSDSSERCGTVDLLEDAAAVGYVATTDTPTGPKPLTMDEALRLAFTTPSAVYFTVSA